MVPDETPTSVDVNVYVEVLQEEARRLQDENVQLKTIVRTLRAKVAALESVPVNGEDYPAE